MCKFSSFYDLYLNISIFDLFRLYKSWWGYMSKGRTHLNPVCWYTHKHAVVTRYQITMWWFWRKKKPCKFFTTRILSIALLAVHFYTLSNTHLLTHNLQWCFHICIYAHQANNIWQCGILLFVEARSMVSSVWFMWKTACKTSADCTQTTVGREEEKASWSRYSRYLWCSVKMKSLQFFLNKWLYEGDSRWSFYGLPHFISQLSLFIWAAIIAADTCQPAVCILVECNM